MTIQRWKCRRRWCVGWGKREGSEKNMKGVEEEILTEISTNSTKCQVSRIYFSITKKSNVNNVELE